jgi:hypothetical protein
MLVETNTRTLSKMTVAIRKLSITIRKEKLSYDYKELGFQLDKVLILSKAIMLNVVMLVVASFLL